MKKSILFISLISLIGLSGCGIFSKKGKCPDCPKWRVEQTQSKPTY